ncbi:MAG: TIGR04255 family protein, partial [Candidatus Brocadiales bacterium]|nr:TIGR04255 family protein [Candidatus Bathyanammoxibius sp.]
IDADDRTLIQVQGNRFTYNWRKRGTEDAYPHYDQSVRPAFQHVWQEFAQFVEKHKLGQVSVVQCEVTYINHLEVGKGSVQASSLAKVFPCWSGKTSGEFLPAPENVGFDVTYRIPDERGRLRISLKPAIRNEDGVEILQLTLTARGKPADSDPDSVLGWLDMGRQWVVRGFTDFTSEQMHTLWQRST